MKHLFIPIMLLLCVFTISACNVNTQNKDDSSTKPQTETKEENTAVYKKLMPQQAKEKMDTTENITILDVRTLSEYETGHIRNAILIPNETIGSQPPTDLPNKDAEILVYCRSGRRSKEAAEKLIALGYTNIYDFGGIIDWQYETTTE